MVSASERENANGGRTPGMNRALEAAQLLIDTGLATETVLQDGKVYSDAPCAGCGAKGRNEVDGAPNAGNPWCARCGGSQLVHLDQTDLGEFENGLCRLGTSHVIHLIGGVGERPVCLRTARVGRMRPVREADAEATCQRCIAERDGNAAYGHGQPAPAARIPGTR